MRLRAILAGGFALLAGVTQAQTQPHTPPKVRCMATDCVNLVFDGDSISAGWGATSGHGLDAQVAAQVGQPVVVRNVAVGGRPVLQCLELYPKLVAPLFDPAMPHNVIVFHAGDNDIAQGHDARQTYAAFSSYVAAAHQQGWKIVVSTELRRFDFPPPQFDELETYNRLLRENAAGADAVVDLSQDIRLAQAPYRNDQTLFSPDRVHPADAGYRLIAALLAPSVRKVAAGRSAAGLHRTGDIPG
ncbi:MAG TPA: SGNH/GDSL hydrolase family protein [Rhodopila sp.]|nr:SGNH/GDSL hydrolase family protein [Rhodopila sp.]